MPVAILRNTNLAESHVDREKGVVTGCQLAKAGKLAIFAGLDGKPVELMATPALIDGLLALCAQEERLPAHYSHDWIQSKSDPIHAVAATWRNFRKSDAGDLLGDLFTWPTQYREAILHAAEFDPRGIMASLVFDYVGGRDNARPISIKAADLVQTGAMTTALCTAILSAFEPNDKPAKTTMTKEELLALVETMDADEKSKLAKLCGVEAPKVDDTAINTAVAAALKEHKAVLSADERTAILTEAEAKVVKAIGANPALRDFNKGGEVKDEFENAITAQLAAGAPNRGAAIMRVANDKPDVYNKAVASGKV